MSEIAVKIENVSKEYRLGAIGGTTLRDDLQRLGAKLFKKEDPFLLDGADSSTLSFDWETEEGIVTVNYNWKNDDPKMQELISLLQSLQQNIKGE